MEAKHTKGPWYFDKETDEVTCTARANMACIAQVETGWYEPFEAEQQANARLIAAAPDLLAVLLLCEGNISSLAASHPVIYTEWLSVVRAAIAKAEGR